ncbi:unnamed protein product, partial [Rotaria sordida]
AAPRAGGHFS